MKLHMIDDTRSINIPDRQLIIAPEQRERIRSGPEMGIVINWLGCTTEAAIIECGLGAMLFFCWFAAMRVLAHYYN